MSMRGTGAKGRDSGVLLELRRRCEIAGDKHLYVSLELFSTAYREMLRSGIRPTAVLNRWQADSARMLHTVRWAGLTLISTSKLPILLRDSYNSCRRSKGMPTADVAAPERGGIKHAQVSDSYPRLSQQAHR